MPISIHPLLETDIPTFVRIELEAFRPHPRIPMLWPNGYTDDLYAYYESSKKKRFHEEDATAKFIKAVDDETGEIMGVCEMTLALDVEKNSREKPMEEDAQPPEKWPEGGNWAMKRWFAINSFWLVRESFEGRAFMQVDILIVNPKYHGRGIGSLLLGCAIKEANEKGVPLALESTPAGLSLYKRHGFKVVKTIKADMKQFGWDQPYDEEAAKRVWMIKDPERST